MYYNDAAAALAQGHTKYPHGMYNGIAHRTGANAFHIQDGIVTGKANDPAMLAVAVYLLFA
jgi:hypothetical protein